MKRTLSILALVGFAAACTPKIPTPETAAVAAKAPVQLAIWSNYLAPETLADFERKTGYKVEVSNYSSNEEMLAKLQAGGTGYDVILPSDYIVTAMKGLNLLLPLDKAKLPNLKHLNPKVLSQSYDPENTHSVPYDIGTTGIAVRSDKVKGKIEGWKDLFESKELAGKFTMLDDAREAMGAALKRNGASLNSADAAAIAQARSTLQQAKKSIKAFNSETLAALVDGSISAAQAYSSDALQARAKTGGKVDFIFPKEGFTVWVDNLAIPKGAKNLDGAHALIDFLLGDEIGAKTAQVIFVTPANVEAFKRLAPGTVPSDSLFGLPGAEMMKDLGQSARLYDDAFTKVKVGR